MDTANRLEEIKKTLSPDQLKYIYERVLCRKDSEAARNIGLSPNTVYGWSNRDDVQEAVNLLMDGSLQMSLDIMRRNLARAAKIKVKGLDSRDEEIAQRAATEILDRFHGKPTQQNNVNLSGGPLNIILTWGDTEAESGSTDDNPT